MYALSDVFIHRDRIVLLTFKHLLGKLVCWVNKKNITPFNYQEIQTGFTVKFNLSARH